MAKQNTKQNAEEARLNDNYTGKANWLQWGPYLSERQWGTVREDYSADGSAWDYFPHDHARSRVYRWGEDGIAGISDDMQRLCFALAMWNGKDPILKERLFGLTGTEGNHGEDVKELYYYLDNTPSHSYMKHLYKYPHAAYPYADLLNTNRNRPKTEPEYELLDTGVIDGDNYFDVQTEYAKNTPGDILIRITISNRGANSAYIALLPTLWCRNLWAFGLDNETAQITLQDGGKGYGTALAAHQLPGTYVFSFEQPVRTLFTDNETNRERLFNAPNTSPYVKDLFHHAVINGDYALTGARTQGTKFSPMYEFNIAGGEAVTVRLRLCKEQEAAYKNPFDTKFDKLFDTRIAEADEFYAKVAKTADADLQHVQRQALAGMLWSKQYYNIDIPRWLYGDPGQPAPPPQRLTGRNHDWPTLNSEDIISMPDKWEYPWYAAWDLGFHCVALSMVDPEFAKAQLVLFMREWYMHPNGQLPAYEWSFGDVNPPVQAWSALRVYNMEKAKTGNADTIFLKKIFHKLLLNFTWWVNRKDQKGNNVFEGGFLGLDNIGVFDRSSHVPEGGLLEQADGTAWMGMFCLNMLEMALELTGYDPSYEDVATKFFEHFIYIAESMNRIGGHWTGCWNQTDGFYYDVLSLPDGRYIPLKVRSLVGLAPMFAVLVIKKETLDKVPEFYRRLQWFIEYRKENGEFMVVEESKSNNGILLSLVPKARMERLMEALLNENEFLSPGGIRSVSKVHTTPFMINIDGMEYMLDYQPGESTTSLFGGNSNWRGPVWMPMNYLIVLALQHYYDYHGQNLMVELPHGSGNRVTLSQASNALAARLTGIFKKDANGSRPVHGNATVYSLSPHFKDLVLFYEYFHGDTSRGVGASHQTGWTGVVADLINRAN